MSENTAPKQGNVKSNNNGGNNRNKNGNYHKRNNYYRHNKNKFYNKQQNIKRDPAVETVQDIQADMQRIAKEIDLEIKEIGSMTLG